MYTSRDFENKELSNIQRAKYISLLKSFKNLGFNPSQSLSLNDYHLFLNNKSSSGYFDSLLCNKIFQFLNFNENSLIPISDFIQGFLLFESEIKRNFITSKRKLSKEQYIYNKILNQCIVHKSEKLNSEGFCEDAKILGEIKDIDIKHKLKGIKEIIIIVIFNDKKEELHFEIGGEATNIQKSFEFRPTSRKDHFEFVMKGINDSGKEYNIGSKIFPLNDIESREKYLIQITVPDLENPKQIDAFINISIVMYMSYLNYYEDLRKKEEIKLSKCKLEANQSFRDLKMIQDIYGFNEQINYEYKDGFKTQRKEFKERIPLDGNKYTLSKRSLSPQFQNKKIEYHYRNNYNSPIKINYINKIERENNKFIHKKENVKNIHINYVNNNMNKTQRIHMPPKKLINLEERIKNFILSSNNQKNNNNNQAFNTTKKIIIDKYSQHKIESNANFKNIMNYQNNNSQVLIQNEQKNTNKINMGINQNNQNKIIQIKQNNLNQLANTTNSQIINSTKIQQNKDQINMKLNEQKEEKKVVTEMDRASIHQIIGEIAKKDTITTETQFLAPIIKKPISIKHSVNGVIVNNIVNKEIVEESTLPVTYLPEKVNELIYYDKITTLPLINIGNKVTHNVLEQTTYNKQIYNNEEEKNVNNNLNLWNLNVNNDIGNDKVIQNVNNVLQNNQNNNILNVNKKNLSNNIDKANQIDNFINIQSSK